MVSPRLDFRAATLDIYANPGSDITWRVQVTDEGIAVGTITCLVGGQTPTVDTSLSIEGMLIADVTLTDTQTATLGSGSHDWSFKNTVAGVTTTYLVGNLTINTAGNSSNGLQGTVTATSATVTVQTLVSTGAATALAAHLIDPTGAHAASAVSVSDSGAYFTGSTVEAALAELAAVTSIAQLRTGNRAIIIGDSIASGNDTQVSYQNSGSWFSDACAKSGQRLRYLRNAGVGGDTSTEMLARFAADVTAYHPDIVVIAPVTPNDVSQAIPVATSKANIQAMVAAAVADGSRVILATSTPNDTEATKNALVSLNQWLVGYANSIGVPVFDIYSPVVDTADGTYESSYTSDGIHPIDAGYRAIGTAVAAALPADLRAVPFLTVAKADPANLITNGVFVNDANADGVADSWSQSGTFSAKSLSTLTGGFGNWQSVTSNGTTAYLFQSIASGWAVGDVLAFGAKIEKDATVSSSVQIQCTGGAYNPRIVSSVTAELTDAWNGYIEFPVPASTTAIEVRLIANVAAGEVKFGQVTLRNLTTLGIA